MLNRPRCRDWTPLATQQLRLRSLVRIIGLNITTTGKFRLYFTLHSSAMSAPFFTSDKVDAHGSKNIEWPEINCQKLIKSNARSVSIRVWECSADSNSANDSNQKSSSPVNDKLLFVWGVYFSGLICLESKAEAKFLPNSLAFQMHEGFFVSPSTLTEETTRQQVTLHYERDFQTPHGSKPLEVSSTRKSIESHELSTCDSKLRCNNGKKTHVSSEYEINSPRTSRSCSPTRFEHCKQPGQDLKSDILDMLKVRYMSNKFHRSEVRASYSLEKLLELQEKQRKIKQRIEYSKEIIDRICTKSAFCLNLELISNKGIYHQPRYNPSMGRTLNRLLFQEPQIKPEDIIKAQSLKRQVETARLRSQVLRQEKQRIESNLLLLQKRLDEMHDGNIELESWLMSCYRSLNREKEALLSKSISFLEKRDLLLRTRNSLLQLRTQLCRELKNIYPIEKTHKGHLTINNVFLPNAEHLSSDAKLLNIEQNVEPISPISLSVALGYTAHVVQMCSVILNIPLRNPVKYEGSRSRIMDVVKELPNISREFPLYSRTNPPPKAVYYAIYLLNQNIAQLNFQVYNIKCDLRATLPNLVLLLDGNAYKSVEKSIDTDLKVSVFGSSMEFNVPVSPLLSQPVNVTGKRINDQRISRSVGSYSDERFSSPNKNIYSSEPVLTVQQMRFTEFGENCDI